jgi:hypothetical protein
MPKQVTTMARTNQGRVTMPMAPVGASPLMISGGSELDLDFFLSLSLSL